jgi:hypothetical protein
MAFPTYNVHFRRAHQENILVTGEIVNETSRNYAMAMFKILVFDKQHLLGSGIIKVHDFHSRAIREFEALIEGIGYKTIAAIFRYEILFEGGY